MTGETNLEKLLATLSPRAMTGEYVFATFSGAVYGDHAELTPVAMMVEAEGLTLVIPRGSADEHRIGYDATFCGITLEVHSSLEAVGLTAAFASGLTAHGISANVIAGFYHDHIFVQAHCKEAAMAVLSGIADEASRSGNG